jgi:subtilisin family serine protease
MSRYIFLAFIILSLVSCGGDGQQYITDNPSSVSSPESSSGSSIQKDSSPETSSGSKRGITAKYVPGEVLVKFKTGTAAIKIHGIHNALRATKIKEVKHIRVQHVKIPADMNVSEAVKYYRSNPSVEYAEPNYIVEKAATVPDDIYFNNLWGLNNIGQTGGTTDADIDAPEAWDITKGSSNIIIAVVDSGVAYNHPDFTGNKWINALEQSGSPGIDDDGNGYVDDIYGWDFIDNDGYPEDYDSHGTYVAGTIAAKGNNGAGITGVMWSAKIMPIRFLGVSGVGSIANAAEAIIYASDNGARIINASWGGYSYSQTLYNAIEYARAKDVLFIGAAGNESNNNDNNPFYPASFNLANIISVAASDQNDQLASFSNYGVNSVDLVAPGVNIYSSIPVFTYGSPVTIYSENFNSWSGDLPLLGWSRGGTNSTWAVTATTGVGGTNSLEDSPGGNYLPDTNSWAWYMAPFNSVKNNLYTLSFKWKGYIDPGTNDYLNINYSSDGVEWDWVDRRDGNTGGSFIAYSTDAITTAADLLDSFYFGFGLESDSAGNYDGVYIDDVVLKRKTVNISDYTYGSYGWSGTSMAAAHVSGVAGLILSVNPSLTYSHVKDIILNNVDVNASLSGKTLTRGRLNAFTSVISAVVPAAPSNLTAAAVSSSQINLAWIDTSNETGFKIERKTDAGGAYIEIATIGANVTNYSDTGLSASTTYYYRVRAYNIAGDSPYSNEASATTHVAPSGGGGCSIGGVHNYQTAVVDTLVLIMPLIVILILRRFRKTT